MSSKAGPVNPGGGAANGNQNGGGQPGGNSSNQNLSGAGGPGKKGGPKNSNSNGPSGQNGASANTNGGGPNMVGKVNSGPPPNSQNLNSSMVINNSGGGGGIRGGNTNPSPGLPNHLTAAAMGMNAAMAMMSGPMNPYRTAGIPPAAAATFNPHYMRYAQGLASMNAAAASVGHGVSNGAASHYPPASYSLPVAHAHQHSAYQGSRIPASSPPVNCGTGVGGGPAFGSATPGGSTSASSAGSTNGSSATGMMNQMGMLPNGNLLANSGMTANMMMGHGMVNSSGGGGSIHHSGHMGMSGVTNHNSHHHSSMNGGSIHGGDQLSKTNLYIRGLNPNTSDRDLLAMCSRYGVIMSTKAILDKTTNKCRGYGFVDFESPNAAESAVQDLLKQGIQAQMAKCTDTSKIKLPSASTPNKMQQEQDPTNLYIANLPPVMNEQELEALLTSYGTVVSTRILRDQNGHPRGVGFARMESKDRCDQIISLFNGKLIPGCKEPLLVKFADGGNKKKSSQFKNSESRAWSREADIPISYEHQPSLGMQLGSYTSPHRPTYGQPGGMSTGPAGSGPYTMGGPPQWMTHAPPYLTLPGHPSMHSGMMATMDASQNPSMHYNPLMSPLAAQISQMSLSAPSAYVTGGSPYAGSSTPGMYQTTGSMPLSLGEVNPGQ